MDPVTAFGLAASVIQVITFSYDLISDGKRIYSQVDGALPENKDTAQLTEDLSILTSRLSEEQRQWRAARNSAHLDPDEARLGEICERCTEIAQDLNGKLNKLKVEGKHRKIKSMKQALVSVWKADELNSTAEQLQKYRNEIQFHITLGLRKSLQENGVQSSQQAKDLADLIMDGSGRVEDQLAQVNDNMRLLAEVVSQERSRSPFPKPPPAYDEHSSATSLANLPLHDAAANGDSLKVRKLLRASDCDINAKDETECTALHVASTADVVKKLLTVPGILINAADYEGRTALHYAVLKRNLGVIKTLLAAGINQDHEDDQDKTAAFYATDCPAAMWLLKYGTEIEVKAPELLDNTGLMQMAWLGDYEGIEFFISENANVNARNQLQKTALIVASQYGDTEVVRMLLAAHADVSAADKDGWTPIQQAVRHGRTAVVTMLLANGAYKKIKSKSGDDLLVEACLKGHFDVARWLIEDGSDFEILTSTKSTPLILAAKRGSADFCRFLLQRRAKTETQDAGGLTALYQAARYGNYDTLEVLLEHKANPELRGPIYKWTPLCIAAKNGHQNCVKLLLDHGVQIDARGHHDHTALAEAAWNGHLEVVRLLVERGARHDIIDSAGHTALSSAAEKGYDNVIRVLASAGADLNAQSLGSKREQFSFTPLMRATFTGSVSTVAVLVELQANSNARNAWGQTALHIAASKGHAKCASVLIQNGSAMNLQDEDGSTALMLAVGRLPRPAADIVKLLVEAGANTKLRNRKMRTAYIWGVHAGEDENLKHLLKPTSNEQEPPTRSVSEAAAHLRSMYS